MIAYETINDWLLIGWQIDLLLIDWLARDWCAYRCSGGDQPYVERAAEAASGRDLRHPLRHLRHPAADTQLAVRDESELLEPEQYGHRPTPVQCG